MVEASQTELAEHFRAGAWYPKGCWVMDAITGRCLDCEADDRHVERSRALESTGLA